VLGIKKQAVHQWETMKNIPSTDALIALADYFDVSLDYLVGRTGDPARR
jgi:transcriptional regulator with XRE-family HTH domain